MLSEYLEKALERAKYETEGGRWFGEIPGFQGVWADAETPEECKAVLREVLEEWLLLKIKDGDDDIPVVAEIDLNTIGAKARDA